MSVPELRTLAERFLGHERTDELFELYARRRGLGRNSDALADGELVQFVERRLAGAIGAASARVMVATTIKGEGVSVDEIMQILDETSQVLEYSRQLEQKSKALEKATADLNAANQRLTALDSGDVEIVNQVSDYRAQLEAITAERDGLRRELDKVQQRLLELEEARHKLEPLLELKKSRQKASQHAPASDNLSQELIAPSSRTFTHKPTLAPSPHFSIDDVCENLSQHLGLFGFQWICACAVYPLLYFPVTAYLGARLAEAVGRPPPSEDEFLAICRLPWFRSGWMPADLRLVLVQRLSNRLQSVTRDAIDTLLFSCLNKEQRDILAKSPADFRRPPRLWRGLLRSYLDVVPTGLPEDDAIFQYFMEGRIPTAFDFRVDRFLTRFLGRRAVLDRKTIIWGCLASATSFLLWFVVL